MFKPLMLLILTSFSFHLIGQQIVSPDYLALYGFTTVKDTIIVEYMNPRGYYLIGQKSESRFHTTSKQYNDSLRVAFKSAFPALLEPTNEEEAEEYLKKYSQFTENRKKPEYDDYHVRKDFSMAKAQINLSFAFPFQHLEESLDFNWQLTEAQDTIAGLLCYQATTTYGGRHYTAWYAPEIPISDGPYVFCGLPGLIVQIADEREWFQFRLKSIQTNPGPRFWSKDYFNPSSQAIDRKTYVDKSVEQKNNPRLTGIIDVTEEMLLKAKKRNSWRYFMLLEWY